MYISCNKIFPLTASLESARKSASDENYRTTTDDEERFGRGKRVHVHFNPYSDQEKDENVQLKKSKKGKRVQVSYDTYSEDEEKDEDVQSKQGTTKNANHMYLYSRIL